MKRAASPVAVASAAAPPSRAAIRFSKTSTVGYMSDRQPLAREKRIRNLHFGCGCNRMHHHPC
jgi:hypothetical protein